MTEQEVLDSILARVKRRLGNEQHDADVVADLVMTVSDRICLRLGGICLSDIPGAFESIAVDASVKALRRIYYEGVKSEWNADLKSEFVADVLAEYNPEFAAYIAARSESGAVSKKVVRFL